MLDPQKYTFKLAYAGQNVTTATATTTVKEQVITGDLDLIKYGNYDWSTQGKGTKPVMLKDTQFTVTSKTTGKVVRTSLTDTQGYVKFTDLPYDTYTVTETKTPTGYNGIKPFTVVVDGTQKSQHYTIENKVIEEKLRVVKVDTETGKTGLRAGAIFRIKNLQTNKYEVQPTACKTGTTDKLATDNSGELPPKRSATASTNSKKFKLQKAMYWLRNQPSSPSTAAIRTASWSSNSLTSPKRVSPP